MFTCDAGGGDGLVDAVGVCRSEMVDDGGCVGHVMGVEAAGAWAEGVHHHDRKRQPLNCWPFRLQR